MIVVLVVVGAGSLQDALGWGPVIAALLVAVLAALVKFNEIAGRVVGGVVVGTLVLLGVNVPVDHIHRPPILGGLLLAIVVFGVAAGWYLRGYNLKKDAWLGRGDRWGLWTTCVVAAGLAIVLLVDVPIIVERKRHSIGSMAMGLGIALVLFAVGVWAYRKRDDVPPARRIAAYGAPLLGLVAIAVVPLVREQGKGGGSKVADGRQVPAKVDVRIVTDGSEHPLPPRVEPDPALRGFAVTYSVGVARGNGVRWTRVGLRNANEALAIASMGDAAPAIEETQAPVPDKEADSVLILLVDGTPPLIDGEPADLPSVAGTAGEVGRWRRIGHAARLPMMPVYALLQSDRDEAKGRRRLRRWEHFTTTTGEAVSIQTLGRRPVTDAGLALAIAAPTADADLSLAVTHRPVLLFDSGEPVPRPLSIEWLFNEDKVHLCHDRGVATSECDEKAIRDPGLLENVGTHLKLDRPKPKALRDIARREAAEAEAAAAPAPAPAPTGVGDAPGADLGDAPAAAMAAPKMDRVDRTGDPETAIYVHAVPVSRGRQQLVYLDYWWYLPDNPVTIGHKVFCGAGLVIPGITCHNHESDWEGMTVVVDRTRTPHVVAVQYAEHDDVVSIPWDDLRARWDTSTVRAGDKTIADVVKTVDPDHQRPLAFIASGTHSTYPSPCPAPGQPKCTQIPHPDRGEDRHDGALRWIGDYSNQCGTSSCVHRLPTQDSGRIPALWNGFEGPWGSKHCALTYYCDSASPPAAPGTQGRYLHPTRCSGTATSRGAGWSFDAKQRCDE